jgi:hypothetical protein
MSFVIADCVGNQPQQHNGAEFVHCAAWSRDTNVLSTPDFRDICFVFCVLFMNVENSVTLILLLVGN